MPFGKSLQEVKNSNDVSGNFLEDVNATSFVLCSQDVVISPLD